MSDFFDKISAEHRDFISKQHVFFIATAHKDGRINLSPKGMDCFRVLGDNQVGYLDVGGSGNETQAHLTVNGRATIMFCAFDGPALIMRLYTHGRAILPQDAEWEAVYTQFPKLPGTRQIFLFEVDNVQTSCGWGVPHMDYVRDRQTLSRHHAAVNKQERLEKISKRTKSIDGLELRVQGYIPE